MNPAELERFFVRPEQTLLEVMECVNQNARGIALVIDSERRLLDTITDGDLRRAVLAGKDLQQSAGCFRGQPHLPITAPLSSTPHQLLALMRQHRLRHIPLLEPNGVVADMALMETLVERLDGSPPPIAAVIMAGGYGVRLRPLTDEVPKPLLKVGDAPVVERTVRQLRDAGIRQLIMATHYRSDAFAKHFGDGQAFGVAIDYVREESPLGTAGVLAELGEVSTPLLVVNGDILTQISYRAMLRFHEENEADLTVALRRYELAIPYGVVTTDGVNISSIREKPVQKFFVNAGIYLLQPDIPRLVPRGRRFDMTDLIEKLVALGKRVIGFPVSEYWLDVGRITDYEQAQVDAENGRIA